MKRYIIIAGVNGAGKTTCYSAWETFSDMAKINLDEEVRSIGNWKNSADVVRAGKNVLKKIKFYFENEISFSQETTLCGNSIFQNIRKAKDLGYIIELYYVGVESAEIAKERVHNRVKQGGHGVSDKDIERRYKESLDNLKVALPLCDKTYVFDNTTKYVNIAAFTGDKCVFACSELPEWFSGNFEKYVLK
jgi:predicted ABC-type ATPase